MSFRTSLAVASTALLVVSGCSAPGGDLPLFPSLFTNQEAPSGGSADADTCATPEACAAKLKMLVSDPVRDWVGRPQPADSYPNGTRLFAYRALKKKLTCDELGRALAETEGVAPSLQAPRYDAARKLIKDVSRELHVEKANRCLRRA